MSYSVYYWTAGTKFVGRAFPIILLLEHAKQKYELKAWPKELPSDALPTFAPPAITTPEGVTFGQLPLCMYELGKKLGHYPENEVDQLFIKQVSLNCLDIIADYKGMDPDRALKWADFNERCFSRSNGPYLCGDQIYFSDFYCLMALRIVSRYLPEGKTLGDNCKKFMAAITALPTVKNWFDKGIPIAPPRK